VQKAWSGLQDFEPWLAVQLARHDHYRNDSIMKKIQPNLIIRDLEKKNTALKKQAKELEEENQALRK
jgi:hypothetical protein